MASDGRQQGRTNRAQHPLSPSPSSQQRIKGSIIPSIAGPVSTVTVFAILVAGATKFFQLPLRCVATHDRRARARAHHLSSLTDSATRSFLSYRSLLVCSSCSGTAQRMNDTRKAGKISPHCFQLLVTSRDWSGSRLPSLQTRS